MNSDERAFLTAILAEPADNTVRLVYADWLEESGQPARAIAIRSMPPGRDPDRWVMPYALIILGCEPPDSPALAGWDRRPPAVASCRFGFIEALECTAGDWLTHGDAICAAHPVEAVTLTTWPNCFHGGDTDSDLDNREEYWTLTADGTMPDDEDECGLWFLRGVEPDTPEMVRALLARRWPRVAFTINDQ